ncbi:hypothetical protein RW1_022_00160 [Rhodococcus wratislaviensis NBRC 100605]|uniref:Lsr2 DNA-binding domain-containing protein n=1 Tax=Rhodococcus wratislaviensis NBRC 100605 TaxID=1219028 RepID=X0R3E6_RHOWR|nr:hypothetical protein RW1_022_00160 [Rhodococcus wratislaviensis NBRC 100605]
MSRTEARSATVWVPLGSAQEPAPLAALRERTTAMPHVDLPHHPRRVHPHRAAPSSESHKKGADEIRVGCRKHRSDRQVNPATVRRSSDETQKTRAWAIEQGYELSSRGRIPTAVEQAFRDAH